MQGRHTKLVTLIRICTRLQKHTHRFDVGKDGGAVKWATTMMIFYVDEIGLEPLQQVLDAGSVVIPSICCQVQRRLAILICRREVGAFLSQQMKELGGALVSCNMNGAATVIINTPDLGAALDQVLGRVESIRKDAVYQGCTAKMIGRITQIRFFLGRKCQNVEEYQGIIMRISLIE